MLLKSKIEQFHDAPDSLERLFRDSESSGDLDDFRRAMAAAFTENPDDTLLAAWAYRLDIRPVAVDAKGITVVQSGSRRWPAAIIIGLLLGLVYAYFADATISLYPDKPRLDAAWAWIGWAPAAALATLAYLAFVDSRTDRRRYYVYAGLSVGVLTMAAAAFFWDAKGDIRILVALHLPFLVWALLGAGITLGDKSAARQFFGYVVKSIEVLLTGVVYLTAGMIFTGLTLGIFSVLQVQPPDRWYTLIAAWGIGVTPVIAVASVYAADKLPAEQEWGMGPASILRVIARLIS